MPREFQISANDLPTGSLVAKGNDSSVYRLGDKVIKIYGQLDPELLERYLIALPRANQLIRRYAYPRRLSIAAVGFELRFDAIDIESRGTVDGKPYTVSQYSPYPNLDILTLPPDQFEEYLNKSFANCAKKSFEFFFELNAAFRNERPTRLYDEFIYAVDLLSRSIDEALGQTGHYIGKYNAKVIPDISERRLTLQITDTAVYIDRVEF